MEHIFSCRYELGCSTKSGRIPSGAGIRISALKGRPRKRRDPPESPALVEEVELRLRTTITPHSITGYELDFRNASPGGYVAIVRWNGPLNSFTTLAEANYGFSSFSATDGSSPTPTPTPTPTPPPTPAATLYTAWETSLISELQSLR